MSHRHLTCAERLQQRRRQHRRGGLFTVIVITMIVAATATGFAYFSATSTGNASATGATLVAPTGGMADTGATMSAIPIKWTAPAGYTPTSYSVKRCTGSCTPSTTITTGGCASPVAALCTDSDPALTSGTVYTYTVTANLNNWFSPESTSFQASTVAAATKLAFTTQPTSGQNIQATGTGSFTVAVAVQNSGGVTQTVDNATTVNLLINNNPGGGVLGCTGGLGPRTVVAGVATFNGCAITKVGTPYTLTATSVPSLTAPTNANPFNITAGNAASLTLAAATTTPTAGAADNLTITAKDSNANTVTTYTGDKSLTFGGANLSPNATNPTVSNKTGVVTNFGTATTITFTSGVATVSGANNGVMKLYKAEVANITVTDGSINNNPGLSVTVSPAVVNKLAFSTVPSGNQTATATATIGAYQVQRQDQFGNPVTGTAVTVNLTSDSTGTKFFSLSSGGNSGTAVTSVSIANGQSTSGNFFYADNKAGSPTLTAQAAGITNNGTTSPTIVAAAASTLGLANCLNSKDDGTSCTPPFSLGNGGNFRANVRLLDQFGNAVTVSGTVSLSVTSGNVGNYTVTSGATLTIDGTATPPNQSTAQFIVQKNGNANNNTTITVHVTAGAAGVTDLVFTVQK